MTEQRESHSRFAPPPFSADIQPSSTVPEDHVPETTVFAQDLPVSQRRAHEMGNAGSRFRHFAGDAPEETSSPRRKKSTVSLIRQRFADAGVPIHDGTVQSQLQNLLMRQSD